MLPSSMFAFLVCSEANALFVAGSGHSRFLIYELGGFRVVIRFRWTESILSTGYRLDGHI